MPIIRKVVSVGCSKAVTLPKSWLRYYKEICGVEVKEVAIEIKEHTLIIKPILPKEKRSTIEG